MKKNIYFRKVFKRNNKFIEAIQDIVLGVAFYPRLMLEIFFRKNMGERYFSITVVVILGAMLWIYPLMGDLVSSVLPEIGRSRHRGGSEVSLTNYGTWYLFLVAFLYFSYRRWKELEKNPSVFDFGRFSLSTGDIHPLFFKLKPFGEAADTRTIETLYEPGAAFLAGLGLYLIGQPIGGLLIIASVFYSLSYLIAYSIGDNFVMDRIDEMILNQEMESAFVNEEDSSKTRGVRFYSHKPRHEDLRRQLADTFVEDDEGEIAEVI